MFATLASQACDEYVPELYAVITYPFSFVESRDTKFVSELNASPRGSNAMQRSAHDAHIRKGLARMGARRHRRFQM